MIVKKFDGFGIDEYGRIVYDQPPAEGDFDTTIGWRHGVRVAMTELRKGQVFIGPDNRTVYQVLKAIGEPDPRTAEMAAEPVATNWLGVRNVVLSHVWHKNPGNGWWEDEGFFSYLNPEDVWVHRIGDGDELVAGVVYLSPRPTD